MKQLVWLGNTKKTLLSFPATVIDVFGYALHLAQIGHHHPDAKMLHGLGMTGVAEIVADHRGNAYRAVYTAKLGTSIYVLHVFQKKSHRDIKTPKPDLALIQQRLQMAQTFAGKDQDA